MVGTLAAPLVLAVVAALGACSGSGSVSSPTRAATSLSSAGLPSTPLPSTALPGAALPTREGPSATLPSGTPSSEPGPTRSVDTAADTATVTATQTQTQTQTTTRTATVTNTQTATQTATRTATVTNTVTQTATQTATQTPTPAASQTVVLVPAGTTPTPAPDEGTTWWPWLLVGLALAGLVWLLVRRRRADAAVRAWDERLAAADGEASWVEDSLTTQVLSRESTAEAQTIWLAAQPRLLQADKDFHDLAADAPDGPRASRAMDVRGLLQGLVEAVGADLAAPPRAGPDDFRARRALVDSARRGLRDALHQVTASVEPGMAGPAPSSPGG